MLILRTCCGADDPCPVFRSALSLLHSFGVEPSMHLDSYSYYFGFQLPREWKLDDRIAFHQALNDGVASDENTQFCISCGSIISPLKSKCCMNCKNVYKICGDCERDKIGCTSCQQHT